MNPDNKELHSSNASFDWYVPRKTNSIHKPTYFDFPGYKEKLGLASNNGIENDAEKTLSAWLSITVLTITTYHINNRNLTYKLAARSMFCTATATPPS